LLREEGPVHRKLNSWHAGSGPPVVLIHGLFASLSGWLVVARRLASRFSVYAVDLRNHGSSFHSAEFNYPVMAADLKRFLDGQGLARAHLVGHSMGGKVAMQFAADFPRNLSRLVVVDMTPRRYPPALDALIDAVACLDPGQYANRAAAVAALAAQVPCLTTRRFLVKNLVRGPDGRLRWRIGLAGIEANRREIYRQLDLQRPILHPSLFVVGENSDYITPSDHALIRCAFPDSQIAVVEGAGHFVQVDAPGAFCALVGEFLR
jgi:pimeloyl-ACP methyl ester carboxylesterase